MVSLGFTEVNYSKAEGQGPIEVVVKQMFLVKGLESPIILKLIPVDFNNISSEISFPYNRDVPNRAKSKEYCYTEDLCRRLNSQTFNQNLIFFVAIKNGLI